MAPQPDTYTREKELMAAAERAHKRYQTACAGKIKDEAKRAYLDAVARLERLTLEGRDPDYVD